MKLTERVVATLGPRLKKNPAHDADFVAEYMTSDGGGLYLSVKGSGHKSWFYIYTSKLSGGREKIGLGGYPAVSLEDARHAAASQRRLLALGVDPRQEHDKKKDAARLERDKERYTIKSLGDAWHQREKTARQWSEGHASRQLALLENHVYPHIGGRYIGDVTEPVVARLLQRVVANGYGETAMRVRGALRDVYEYACGVGALKSDENFMRLGTNIGGLKKPASRSFAAFDVADPEHRRGLVGEFMRRIRGYQGRGPIVHVALCLSPYLGQRPGQYRRMRWEQLDLKAWLWTCPPQIMKQSTEAKNDPRTLPHLVPLPRQAVELLEFLRPITGATGEGYVFPGQRPGRSISENTVNAALRALGYDTKTEITGHGVRSLLQTLSQDDLDIPVAWSDRHLAHKPHGPLGARYDRSAFVDQRFELVQKYADLLDYLADTAGPGAPNPIQRVRQQGKIIEIRAARAA